MDKLRKVLGRGGDEEGDPEQPSALERAKEASTLEWGTRMKGFLVFFILGAGFSLLATFMLWLPTVGLVVFVVFYTIGNISILVSLMFLVGPCRQLRSMFAKERVVATILMVGCLVVTLCSAYLLKNFTLALIFCLLQVLAFLWYALSYIPFARDCFVKCCSCIFCR